MLPRESVWLISGSVKCEDDFAGFAAFHGLDGGFVFGEGHLVGDDGGDVEAFFVE